MAANCGRCWAKPGDRCVTPAGGRCDRPHQARVRRAVRRGLGGGVGRALLAQWRADGKVEAAPVTVGACPPTT
jgi:hypothetical protein